VIQKTAHENEAAAAGGHPASDQSRPPHSSRRGCRSQRHLSADKRLAQQRTDKFKTEEMRFVPD